MSIPRPVARRIPGLAPGILFLAVALSVAGEPALQLAAELYAEGEWAAARTESLRVPAGAPDAARARLLAAASALRLEPGQAEARAELAALWRGEAADRETRCLAAYESGRAEWTSRAASDALAGLKFAYLNTREPTLFWRAGCSLHLLLQADKKIRREEAALGRSLLSCRDAWPAEVWRECRFPKTPGPARTSLPGHWVVGFYRAQVGPAIGSRCDLLPSCSEYFLQASRAHGLLGVALMADRFIREPSVVAARARPVTMPDGHVRFADPVSDHDFWMEGK